MAHVITGLTDDDILTTWTGPESGMAADDDASDPGGADDDASDSGGDDDASDADADADQSDS